MMTKSFDDEWQSKNTTLPYAMKSFVKDELRISSLTFHKGNTTAIYCSGNWLNLQTRNL